MGRVLNDRHVNDEAKSADFRDTVLLPNFDPLLNELSKKVPVAQALKSFLTIMYFFKF